MSIQVCSAFNVTDEWRERKYVLLKRIRLFANKVATWLRGCFKIFIAILFKFSMWRSISAFTWNTEAFLKIWNCLEFQFTHYRDFIDLALLRSVSVNDFQSLSPSWLLFTTNVNAIFWDHPFCSQTKTTNTSKATAFL